MRGPHAVFTAQQEWEWPAHEAPRRFAMNTIPYQLPGVWREAVVLPDAGRDRIERPMPGEVFLWHVDLSAIDMDDALKRVPAIEQKRDPRWTYRKDFGLWLCGRAALRTVLGWHLGERPRDVRIGAGAGGKPELEYDFFNLHFSVARSGTRALVALAAAPIGVDLAPVRPDFSWRLVANHWFHPREQEALAAAAPADRPGMFFQIWAHKEAVAKAVGGGFDRQSMASFAVAPAGGATHRPEKSWQLWHLTPLGAPADHKASLASAYRSTTVLDRGAFSTETAV
jgi:4'-phosphopantetheinyl transferase